MSDIYGRVTKDLTKIAKGEDPDAARERLTVAALKAIASGLGPLGSIGISFAEEMGYLPKGSAEKAKRAVESGQIEEAGFYDPDGEQRVVDWVRSCVPPHEDWGMFAYIGAQRQGKTSWMAMTDTFWLPPPWGSYADGGSCEPGEKPGNAYWANYPEKSLEGTPYLNIKFDVDELLKLQPGSIVNVPDATRLLATFMYGSDLDRTLQALIELMGQLHIRMKLDFHNTSSLTQTIYTMRFMGYKALADGWQAKERQELRIRAERVMDAFNLCTCRHPVRVHDGGGGSCHRCRDCEGVSLVIAPDKRKDWGYVFAEEAGYSGLVRARKRPPWYSRAFSEAHAEQDLADLIRLRRKKPEPAKPDIEDGEFREAPG